MEMKEMIARINFLARKKRTVGLTESELIEQKELYEMYLGNIRAQVKQKLDSITFVDKEDPVLWIRKTRYSTDVYFRTRHHLLRRRLPARHQ